MLGQEILGHEMLVGPATAFLVPALTIRLLRAPAIRLGLVDHPNHRKRHQGVVPEPPQFALAAAVFLGYTAFSLNACCLLRAMHRRRRRQGFSATRLNMAED